MEFLSIWSQENTGWPAPMNPSNFLQMTAYRALALQVTCDAVNNADDPRATMAATIARLDRQISASKGFIGPDCQLVVLPEYFLTSFPLGDSIDAWAAKGAVEPGGHEETLLGAVAQRNRVYLSGNLYETDAAFPGLYLQSSLIWAPNGDIVLRYRRLHSLFAPTPHDLWDRYIDTYGVDSLFPVVQTELGSLACIASEEILFPELARALTMRGAEVLLHSTSEVGSPRQTQKDVGKLARAQENLAYVISANSAGIAGIDIPLASTDGKSQIVDYTGKVMVEAGTGESMVANAELDLDALRRYRKRPGMGNLLARNRFELWAGEYSRAVELRLGHPANNIDPSDVPGRPHFLSTHQQVIERLSSQGVLS
jgi:deaminated glutathione amidase